MENLEALQQLYTEYLDESTQVRKKASRFAGILGLGDDPRKHPCHEIFYHNVERWINGFVGDGPTAEQAMDIARYMLEAPRKHREEEGYWFLYACTGHMRRLVPLLNKEDCKTLVERFDALYPRMERMPVQEQLYKQLKKAAK